MLVGPMRPVTPFMMMPSVWVILNAFRMTEGQRTDDGRRKSKKVTSRSLGSGLILSSSVLCPLSSVIRHQQPVDAPGIFAEFLAGLHFERARMGKSRAGLFAWRVLLHHLSLTMVIAMLRGPDFLLGLCSVPVQAPVIFSQICSFRAPFRRVCALASPHLQGFTENLLAGEKAGHPCFLGAPHRPLEHFPEKWIPVFR